MTKEEKKMMLAIIEHEIERCQKNLEISTNEAYCLEFVGYIDAMKEVSKLIQDETYLKFSYEFLKWDNK